MHFKFVLSIVLILAIGVNTKKLPLVESRPYVMRFNLDFQEDKIPNFIAESLFVTNGWIESEKLYCDVKLFDVFNIIPFKKTSAVDLNAAIEKLDIQIADDEISNFIKNLDYTRLNYMGLRVSSIYKNFVKTYLALAPTRIMEVLNVLEIGPEFAVAYSFGSDLEMFKALQKANLSLATLSEIETIINAKLTLKDLIKIFGLKKVNLLYLQQFFNVDLTNYLGAKSIQLANFVNFLNSFTIEVDDYKDMKSFKTCYKSLSQQTTLGVAVSGYEIITNDDSLYKTHEGLKEFTTFTISAVQTKTFYPLTEVKTSQNETNPFVTFELAVPLPQYIEKASSIENIDTKLCTYVTIGTKKLIEHPTTVHLVGDELKMSKALTVPFKKGSPLICDGILYGLAAAETMFTITFDTFMKEEEPFIDDVVDNQEFMQAISNLFEQFAIDPCKYFSCSPSVGVNEDFVVVPPIGLETITQSEDTVKDSKESLENVSVEEDEDEEGKSEEQHTALGHTVINHGIIGLQSGKEQIDIQKIINQGTNVETTNEETALEQAADVAIGVNENQAINAIENIGALNGEIQNVEGTVVQQKVEAEQINKNEIVENGQEVEVNAAASPGADQVVQYEEGAVDQQEVVAEQAVLNETEKSGQEAEENVAATSPDADQPIQAEEEAIVQQEAVVEVIPNEIESVAAAATNADQAIQDEEGAVVQLEVVAEQAVPNETEQNGQVGVESVVTAANSADQTVQYEEEAVVQQEIVEEQAVPNEAEQNGQEDKAESMVVAATDADQAVQDREGAVVHQEVVAEQIVPNEAEQNGQQAEVETVAAAETGTDQTVQDEEGAVVLQEVVVEQAVPNETEANGQEVEVESVAAAETGADQAVQNEEEAVVQQEIVVEEDVLNETEQNGQVADVENVATAAIGADQAVTQDQEIAANQVTLDDHITVGTQDQPIGDQADIRDQVLVEDQAAIGDESAVDSQLVVETQAAVKDQPAAEDQAIAGNEGVVSEQVEVKEQAVVGETAVAEDQAVVGDTQSASENQIVSDNVIESQVVVENQIIPENQVIVESTDANEPHLETLFDGSEVLIGEKGDIPANEEEAETNNDYHIDVEIQNI